MGQLLHGTSGKPLDCMKLGFNMELECSETITPCSWKSEICGRGFDFQISKAGARYVSGQGNRIHAVEDKLGRDGEITRLSLDSGSGAPMVTR